MSHLLRYFGIELPARSRPPEPPPPEPGIRTTKDFIRDFARYYRGSGCNWRGVRFDGMESEPLDAEGARLANLLRELTQEQRWRVHNRAVRMVVG